MHNPVNDLLIPKTVPPLEANQRSRSAWTLLLLLLLISLGIRLALAPVLKNRVDRRHFVGASHKTLRYGLASIYEPVEGYDTRRRVMLPYPPVPVYCYALVGRIYQAAVDPNFRDIAAFDDLPVDSLSLTYLIKLPIFLFDLLLTALLFLYLRRQFSDRQALVCAALYALNPVTLYNGTLWAQPDSIHCAFLAFSIVFLLERRYPLCLLFFTLAALSKPQAIIFAPILVLLVFRNSNLKQRLQAASLSFATALLIFLPFLLQDRQSILKMLDLMSTRGNAVSANAHNFWWLIMSIAGLEPRVEVTTTVFWKIDYLTLSLALLAIFYIPILVKFLKKNAAPPTAELFAYIAMMFFMLSVRMHENHGVQVLPLLLLTGLASRHLRVIFFTLTLTMLANLLLYGREYEWEVLPPFIYWARIAGAITNHLIFAYWSYTIYRNLPPDRLSFTDATTGRNNPRTVVAEAGENGASSVDGVNAKVSAIERIRNILVLDRDLSIEADEVTPTLKVKRNPVAARYKEQLERLYL